MQRFPDSRSLGLERRPRDKVVAGPFFSVAYQRTLESYNHESLNGNALMVPPFRRCIRYAAHTSSLWSLSAVHVVVSIRK